MNPTTKTSNEELKGRVTKFTRLAISSDCVIAAALIFEAVAPKLHCDTPNTAPLANLAIAAGVIGAVLFHHLADKAGDELLGRSDKNAKEASLALEKFRAPRELRSLQIERVAERLRQFAGAHFVAGIAFQNPEFITLLENVEEALDEADWVEIDCPSSGRGVRRPGKCSVCTGTDAKNAGFGVVITASVNRQEPASAVAAMALATVLEEEGVETGLDVMIEIAPPEMSEVIYITIGPKR